VNTSDPKWVSGAIKTREQQKSKRAVFTWASRGEILFGVASMAKLAPYVRRIHVVTMNQTFSLELLK
jgi:hypothetical protein